MLESLFFKVKKVKFKDGEIVGLITPVCKNNYFNSGVSGNSFNLISLDGKIEENININRVEVLTTRITDKEIKSLIDEIACIEKEKYQNFKKILKLKEEIEKKNNENSTLSDKTTTKLEEIVEVRGFISEKQFNEIIDKNINLDKRLTVDFDIRNNVIKEIKFIKEVDLGKYIREGEYSFLFFEYDGNLMVYNEDGFLENCEDFKNIKRKNFRSPKNKVLKYNVSEEYTAETGDKNSASVYQIVKVKDVNIEVKKGNVNEILNIIRDLNTQLS